MTFVFPIPYRKVGEHFCSSSVPELTAVADVKLNERHSLSHRKDRILITALKTGFDFHDQILNLPWYETND
jgi:hypothetical protein